MPLVATLRRWPGGVEQHLRPISAHAEPGRVARCVGDETVLPNGQSVRDGANGVTRLLAPQGMRTEEFLLRPIVASDAALDYEAVMESRDFLRGWEQTGWPENDFTIEANRADLTRMEQRHDKAESFTYTVMKATETQCLGCVYVFPSDARLFTEAQVVAVNDDKWSDFEAVIYFWIRTSRIADALDRRLLDTLGRWIQHNWCLERYLLVSSEQCDQQVALIQSTDRRLRFELNYPDKTGKELAYA